MRARGLKPPSSLAKEPTNVLGAVNDSEYFDAAFNRPVDDENLFEPADTKQPKSLQFGCTELGIPAHLRLCGQERERLVC